MGPWRGGVLGGVRCGIPRRGSSCTHVPTGSPIPAWVCAGAALVGCPVCGVLCSHPSGDPTPAFGQGAVPSGNPWDWDRMGRWADRSRAAARHPVGSSPAAEPNSQSRGCRAGATVPGTPHGGHPRGHGAPAVSVAFPQLHQGGFSGRAGSRPGRRSRSPSLLYPVVLAAGVFPSLPFPDVTESPPKLTPTSLPRSRGSKPNVVLPSWALLP